MARRLLLLRCAPVLLTTSSLTFSFSQYLFLSPYLELPSGNRAHTNEILRLYIRREFPAGLATILVLYPLTWATAAANLATGAARGIRIAPATRHLTPASWYLYLAGLLFNVGHLLWAPRAKSLMEEIGGLRSDQVVPSGARGQEAEERRDGLALLRTWLRVHIVRSLLSDLPGWLCFTAGFLLTRPFR